jgi:hypothetical protein
MWPLIMNASPIDFRQGPRPRLIGRLTTDAIATLEQIRGAENLPTHEATVSGAEGAASYLDGELDS